MDVKFFSIFAILIIAVGLVNVTKADDDDYDYLPMCDSRCEIRHRVNPFAEGCDSCCRQRGYRKGKCGGFGWSYCKCKRHNQFRTLLNTLLNNQLQG